MTESERGRSQLERLTFFSDAVFAIAMTLLVIEVKLPHVGALSDAALGEALLRLIPNYIGFLISFLVLARFWVAHHSIMAQLKSVSGRLVTANLALLLVVAFMPFPTAVISEYVQLRVAIGFYCAWLTLLGLCNRWLVEVALEPALVDESVDPATSRFHRRVGWIAPAIGATAFVAGMVAPPLALVALIASPVIASAIRRTAR